MTLEAVAVVSVPVVVALGQILLGRHLKRQDESRSAQAKQADDDRRQQTAILNQIKGAVGGLDGRLTRVEARLDGHDKEIGRLFTGAFEFLNRREDPRE